jgi:hypothetical protein
VSDAFEEATVYRMLKKILVLVSNLSEYEDTFIPLSQIQHFTAI